MRYQIFSPKKLMLMLIPILTGLFCLSISSCSDSNTEKDENDSVGELTNQNFYHLKLDRATVVDSFFNKNSANPFNKILFSYTVGNYSTFPASLTLVAYGAKANDDFIDCDPEMLMVKDTTPVSIPSDVLFSTLELSRNKLRRLVGNDGQGIRYDELIFIPYVKDSCGKKFLSYKVRTWPPLGGGSPAEEELNPCPPNKPNQN